MKFEDLNDPLYKMDKAKLSKIIGGYTTTSGGGSLTVGAGTPHQQTINYSSDTVRFDDVSHEETGRDLHQCANGNDPNCTHT